MLKYPWQGLQVKSHVHPKFVICHIGITLRGEDEDFFSYTWNYREPGGIGPPEVFRSSVKTLLDCKEIYGTWISKGVDDGSLETWKKEEKKRLKGQRETNPGSGTVSVATTPG
jgi:hypothetical protein